jgi:choice-of-anchor A domain-containing protein
VKILSHYFVLPLATAVVAGVATQAQAISYSLGDAAGYNVFVLNDYDLYNTDVEGKLAVGGDFTAQTFGVGSKLRGDSHGTTLLVGGDVTLENGKVYGDAVYGGSATVANNVGFEFRSENNDIIRRGSITKGSPIDFAAVGSYLKGLASSIYSTATSLVTTQKVENQFGNIFTTITGVKSTVFYEQYQPGVTLATLTGTDSDVNIFNLSGDWIKDIRKLTFKVPDASKVIVNVTGSTLNLSNFGIAFGDKYCNDPAIHFECRQISQNVLFNFHEATDIDISQVGFMGSILAPNADVDFNNGHINGSLIASSLKGTGESHLYLYNGANGSSGASTPEPAALLGLGLLGLTLRGLKRQPAA